MENQTQNPVIQTQPQNVQAVSSTNSVNFGYAALWKRIAAWFVDFVLWFGVIGYLVALLTNQTTANGFNLTGLSAVFPVLFGFSYFVIMEGTLGQTVGKMLFKIRVLNEDGSEMGLKEALIRNFSRLIDMLPFFYVVGLISISKSDKKQRVGDKLANTVVITK